MTRVNYRIHFIMIGALFVLSSCSAPIEINDADTSVTPQQVVSVFERYRSHEVAWGGVIIEGKNLATQSQLEILAYPLDSQHRPQTSAPPTGRFIAQVKGYLETAEYKAGRLVTVVGTVNERYDGKVGDSEYHYPVLKVSTMYLWPIDMPPPNEPRFYFGIGVGIHH